MISGSLASIHYGEPRLTLDVDLAVRLNESEIPCLQTLFSQPEFYLPPPEVLACELSRVTRGHFNVLHLATGNKADFYPSRNHPYNRWAWEHRHLVQLGTSEVYFAPPEYVILWKLEFLREGGSDKHLRDIRSMLLVSADAIDIDFISHATAELGLTPVWNIVLAHNT